MTDFFLFLENHNIAYERHDHPAVYTVEEADRLVPELPGAKTKNLFLRDDKGRRHFLVLVPSDKRVDLKALREVLGVKRISFGSPERLKKYLGIEPGAVSLLAVYNDSGHKVEVFMDRDLWAADTFLFHPLVNTSTLVMERAGIERFLGSLQFGVGLQSGRSRRKFHIIQHVLREEPFWFGDQHGAVLLGGLRCGRLGQFQLNLGGFDFFRVG